jgi:hypothetical protein
VEQRATATLQRTRARFTPSDDFSTGEVLADGVRAWLSELPRYAGVAFLVHLPLALLIALRWLVPGYLLAPIFVAAEWVFVLLVKAALTKAVLEARRGVASDFRELLEALRKTAPRVLLLGARIFLVAVLKLLKLVLPAAVWLSETFAAVPQVIAAGGSSAAALRRSEQIIEGARLRVFGVCLLIWALAWTLPFACGLQHGGKVVTVGWMLAYLLVRALDSSLAAVLAATAYDQLLQRPQA